MKKRVWLTPGTVANVSRNSIGDMETVDGDIQVHISGVVCYVKSEQYDLYYRFDVETLELFDSIDEKNVYDGEKFPRAYETDTHFKNGWTFAILGVLLAALVVIGARCT